MFSSRKDEIVRFTGYFAYVYRLPNVTGATAYSAALCAAAGPGIGAPPVLLSRNLQGSTVACFRANPFAGTRRSACDVQQILDIPTGRAASASAGRQATQPRTGCVCYSRDTASRPARPAGQQRRLGAGKRPSLAQSGLVKQDSHTGGTPLLSHTGGMPVETPCLCRVTHESQCCCPSRTHRAAQAGREALSLL